LPKRKKTSSKEEKEHKRRAELLRTVALEMLQVKNDACSLTNFAVKMMQKLFSKEELSHPLVTVNGNKPKGDGPQRRALSPVRIGIIHDQVLSMADGDANQKIKQWKACVSGMHKKLSKLRKARFPNELSNSTTNQESNSSEESDTEL
jgi:hypothetical protein